ncbi:NACHT domain-containing protein [Rhodococcus erythropolis]|uniref:NACHT domain-containing protein n=1 Tax=Rhodococcus erythropolis TaxID=1833 RepID=UPI0022B3CFC0|nr:hypothetical protein [Rhodococcus erythropolis]MCZ4570181.1 hypothetical protein [Rhodococcus erythropolis]
MTDYALHRMNSREFEHVSQALLLKTFGAAVEIFGDGADNGREAVYSGTLVWAENDHSLTWTGNTVFQAKFLQEPRDTSRDTRWFQNEVRKELELWKDPHSTRRQKIGLPDNILFITNVTLGPGPNGGLDTTVALMNGRAAEIGLARVNAWHYDTIGRLLDGQSDIRRAFAGLITPGDVLAKLQDILTGQTVDVGKMLIKHARRTVIEDQSIRLSDSGDPTQGRLLVNQIAIDLPVRLSRKGAPALTGATQLAIAMGDRCLKPSVLATTDSRFNPAPRNLLLLGGPGQGKTTLSQLIVSAYRVEFARTYGDDTGSPGLPQTLDHMIREGIDLPKNRRWPLRIDLAKFAEHAAGGLGTHLLKWVAEDLSARSIHDIKAADLAVWLRNWPCALILDGYDEVVAPTAREAVTNAVHNLIEDARDDDIDLFVIVTSRPQGYGDELRDLSFETAELRELTTDQSLDYARRLIHLRHRDDPAFAEEVIDRIEQAVDAPLTARLMTTPLQTTIMTMINETSARAPQTRWELFNTYYETIYRRESNKSGGMGLLLSRHRDDVNDIHEQTARQIQYATEKSNLQDAVVSRNSLREIIIERLVSEGQSAFEAASLAERIMKAATERLVLLVPQNHGDVGFEIRSLREYLVARSMASGEKEDILERLRATRDSYHWRNIWLLAAGRIFAERPELRQSLVDVLGEHHANPAIDQIVPFGAQVAIDLLADGLGSTTPKYRLALFDQAVKMMDYSTGFHEYSEKLAVILGQFAKDDTERRRRIVFQLQKFLKQDIEGSVVAWSILEYVQEDPKNPLRSSLNQLVSRAREQRTELETAVLNSWIEGGLPVALRSAAFTVKSLGTLAVHLSSTLTEKANDNAQSFLGAVELASMTDESESIVLISDVGTAQHSLLMTDLSDATIVPLAHVALELDEADWCVRVLIADQIQRALGSRPVWRLIEQTFVKPEALQE